MHHKHHHRPETPLHATPPFSAVSEKLQWSDAMLVGNGLIDEAHEEFVQVVTSLAECTQHSALTCLQAVQEHLVSHFMTEQELMEKTDFPAVECHLDEHQKVLDAVQKVTVRAMIGEVGLQDVKRLARALTDWFPGHKDYMDSALSAWISKKVYGGAPVVVRRNLQATLTALTVKSATA